MQSTGLGVGSFSIGSTSGYGAGGKLLHGNPQHIATPGVPLFSFRSSASFASYSLSSSAYSLIAFKILASLVTIPHIPLIVF